MNLIRLALLFAVMLLTTACVWEADSPAISPADGEQDGGQQDDSSPRSGVDGNDAEALFLHFNQYAD